MTVRCITCSNWNPKGAGVMAHLGFGFCKLRAKWEFVGAKFERECKAHKEAAADVVAARVRWIEKK